MRYQQQISDMNFEMLKKQYETIQKMYTEKRMMLHDSVHQDVLILEYLHDRKYEEAQTYFEKKIAATKKRSRNRYTGIEVLNLMLNYEIEQAEEKTIKEWRIIMKKNNKLGWHDICNYVGYIGV